MSTLSTARAEAAAPMVAIAARIDADVCPLKKDVHGQGSAAAAGAADAPPQVAAAGAGRLWCTGGGPWQGRWWAVDSDILECIFNCGKCTKVMWRLQVWVR